jgi:hypothetical protein
VAAAVAVVVPPLVDAIVHLPVAADARSFVEELGELKVRVPEHRHRRPSALKLKPRMEKPNKN